MFPQPPLLVLAMVVVVEGSTEVVEVSAAGFMEGWEEWEDFTAALVAGIAREWQAPGKVTQRSFRVIDTGGDRIDAVRQGLAVLRERGLWDGGE